MLRIALGLLLLLCMGPAPGEVGGCGNETLVADAEYHCRQTGYRECQRFEIRGDIDDLQACVDEVYVRCEESTWPFNCGPDFPTVQESQACIDALSLVENVDVDREDIPECRQLCADRIAGGG